jgi:hypothetical protein
MIDKKKKPVDNFFDETGIADNVLAATLQSFSEIEEAAAAACIYPTATDADKLAQAQVRATLLLAAQVKRAADALERVADTMDDAVGPRGVQIDPLSPLP